MFTTRAGFLDRVEQSFILFKDNIKSLVIPMMIFNFIVMVIIPLVVTKLFFWFLPIEEFFSQNGDIWTLSHLSVIITLWITVAIAIFILYIICLIPLQIGIIKTIKNSIEDTHETIWATLRYGMRKMRDAFRVYWYVFSYTLLLPACVFIVWGILLNIGLYYNTSTTEVMTLIWIALMSVSAIFSIFSMIYRGTKASFAMVNAIDKDSFYKDNFSYAIKITDGKWWRVFGNLFWIWVMWSLAVGLIGWLWESIALLGNDWSIVAEIETEKEEIQYFINSFTEFNVLFFINWIIQTLLNTLLWVFISVFVYVFYKRLEEEASFDQIETPSNKKQQEL